VNNFSFAANLDGNLNSEVTSCPEALHLVSEEDRVCGANEEDVDVNPTDQHLTIGLRFAKLPQVFVNRIAELIANLSERPKQPTEVPASLWAGDVLSPAHDPLARRLCSPAQILQYQPLGNQFGFGGWTKLDLDLIRV